MIHVPAVQPTARELRGIRGGWGATHWIAMAPWIIPYVGLLALMALLLSRGEPRGAPWVPFAVVLATYGLWFVAAHAVQWSLIRAGQTSPSGRTPLDWTLDAEGVTQTNGLMTSRFRWEAVREVREESDRFVLLIAPQTNPVLPRRLLDEAQFAALRGLIDDARKNGRLGRGVD